MSPNNTNETDCYLVYVTAASADDARGIATMVVKERLAACANILGPVESIYRWKGKMETSSEVSLVLKTTGDQVEPLVRRIVSLHGYDCPCVVALPIQTGHPPFLQWIRAEVGEK